MYDKLIYERIVALLQKAERILCMKGPDLIRDTGRSREIESIWDCLNFWFLQEAVKFVFLHISPVSWASLCYSFQRCAEMEIYHLPAVWWGEEYVFSHSFPFSSPFLSFICPFSSSLGAEKDQKHCNCFIWWPVIPIYSEYYLHRMSSL